MRMGFILKSEADAFSDSVHQRLIASEIEYENSVKAGHTLRWAISYQDLDESGKVIGETWWVNLKERVANKLLSSERNALQPYRVKEVATEPDGIRA